MKRPARHHRVLRLPLVFASILAVTGTGQSVVIPALLSPSTVLSGGSAHAVLEASQTDLADRVELGAGA